jgi:hypothetical protein
MTGRRPMRSASMLMNSAPSSTPKFAAAKTGPSVRWRNSPLADDRRRRVAQHLYVEPIHDQHAMHKVNARQ